MEKVFGPKAQSFDEANGSWVTFPNGKSYLLPIVSRETKIVPSFDEDDDVAMTVDHADQELAGLVDRFLVTLANAGKTPSGEIVPKVDGKGHVVLTPRSYAEFIGLMKVLLSRNYAFSNWELASILTFSRPKLGMLMDAVVKHLMRE